MFRTALHSLRALFLATAFVAGAAHAATALLWLDGGRPTAAAYEALDVLAAAGEQGLDARDYDAQDLRRRFDRAREAGTASAAGDAQDAQLDAALTQALQRYLTDLRSGRVEPRQIHARFDVPRQPPLDTLALLQEAVAAHRVAQALHEAEPRLPMYAALRDALAKYRALADHPAWQSRLPALPARSRKVAPGQPYAGVPLLTQRLALTGDLAPNAQVPQRHEGNVYEGVLVDAVRAFQQRHGLTADGVIGAATLQQLEVSPAARARQIALAMERLRWTPFMRAPRMVVINIPEFVLRAYEVNDGRIDVKLTSRVVVGKALDTRTPLFGEDMRFIEFSPYWNVPPSIARNETVPRLRRDPAYFDQQGFEFVTPAGQVVRTLSPSNLDNVLRGGWRIRQRPGPANALGDIKFVFPNNDNIYLHHTPAVELFERDRRDFSHGCIRVQLPVELAKFVLQGEPAWTEDRIRTMMEKGVSTTIALRQPVPVLIAYSTVIVKQGRVFFYADLYGHDRLLDNALQARTAGRNSLPGGRASQ